MTLQTIDTTLNAGDTGKAGGDKINAMFAEVYGPGFAKLAPASDIAVIYDGDSKGLEPYYAMQQIAFRNRLGILFNAAQLNLGGTNTGTGTSVATSNPNLLNPTRLANAQAACATAKANGVFDYSLKIGVNDLSAGTPTQTIIANVRKFHETIVRPGGARYLLLWAVDPTASVGSTGQINSINTLYKSYADANSKDVIFLNPYNAILDATSTTGALVGASTNSATAYSRDGLHLNLRGDNAIALSPAIDTAIRSIYRQRAIIDLSLGGAYDATTARYGNFFGGQGRLSAMGGSGTVTGATVVSGTPPAGWTVSGNAAGASLTWSVVTSNPTLEAATGNANFSVVRLALSGTLTANMDIALSKTAFPDSSGGAIAVGDILVSAGLVNFNAAAGLTGVSINAVSGAGPTYGSSSGGTSVPGDTLPPINGLVTVHSDPVTLASVPGGYTAGFDVYGLNGAVLGGSIDFIVYTMGKRGPIPTATP
jgi:hypothetical protein